MPILLNNNIQVNAPKPLDDKYLKDGVPYTSVADVNANLLAPYRSIGQTVLVDVSGVNTEYWYREGVADSDLVVKVPSSPPAITIANVTGLQAALNLKAPIDSPSFTGVPTSINPDLQDNSTRIATTAWVRSYVAGGVSGVSSVNSKTGDIILTKVDVQLNNVDNTTDLNKPVSVATQTALNLKADKTQLSSYALLASPAFTGIPTAPTAALGTDTGQLATTAFVQDAIAAIIHPETNPGTPGDTTASYVNVKDYGAKGDGVTDDRAAINSALASGAKYIIFEKGKTYITNGILVIQTGTTVDGNGAILKAGTAYSTGTDPMLTLRYTNVSLSTSTVSIPLVKGASTFTYAGTGLQVGHFVKLNNGLTINNNSGSNFTFGYFGKIIKVSGTTYTVNIPFYDNFTATSISAMVGTKDVTVRNFTIDVRSAQSAVTASIRGMFCSYTDNTLVDNITILGKDGNEVGLNAPYCNNVTFERMKISGFLVPGAAGSPFGTGALLSGNNVTIRNSEVLFCGEGIVGGSNSMRSQGVYYENNIVRTIGEGKGLDFHSNMTNCVMRGNYMYSSYTDTYAMQVRCGQSLIENNVLYMDNSGNGSSSYKAIMCGGDFDGETIIRGNRVYARGHCISVGIQSQPHDRPLNFITIENNYLEGSIEVNKISGERPVQLGRGFAIRNNYIKTHANSTRGIYFEFDVTADNWVIEKNTIINSRGNTTNGCISIGAAMGPGLIAYNNMVHLDSANAFAPIILNGAVKIRIQGNTLTTTAANAIFTDSSASKENWFDDNKVFKGSSVFTSAPSSFPVGTAWLAGKIMTIDNGTTSTTGICRRTGTSSYAFSSLAIAT